MSIGSERLAKILYDILVKEFRKMSFADVAWFRAGDFAALPARLKAALSRIVDEIIKNVVN